MIAPRVIIGFLKNFHGIPGIHESDRWIWGIHQSDSWGGIMVLRRSARPSPPPFARPFLTVVFFPFPAPSLSLFLLLLPTFSFAHLSLYRSFLFSHFSHSITPLTLLPSDPVLFSLLLCFSSIARFPPSATRPLLALFLHFSRFLDTFHSVLPCHFGTGRCWRRW